MKTIVCEQPFQFMQKDGNPPERKRGEAIVRIRRIGICGTDLHAYRGNQPYFTYPRVLGHELAGEIWSIDDNAYGLQEGDQVTVIPYLECGTCIACRRGRPNCCTQVRVLGVHQDGGMCEYLSVPFDHLLKTEGISLDQAAVIEPLSIGAHAVRRGEIVAGETVLVIGAGPIGLGVMKFAKLAGAKVIAMDINEQRLAFCRAWADVDDTVNALQDAQQQLSALTDGDFPTVVFDATGNPKSMEQSFSYVAHTGRLVLVGLVKSDISFSDPEFHKREMEVYSSRNATRQDFEYVTSCLRDGHIDTDTYITHRSTFDDMLDQFDSWTKPETGVIKAMVHV